MWHTNWRVIVFERPDVFHYNRGNPYTVTERFTGYQFFTQFGWERETEHPRYNHNVSLLSRVHSFVIIRVNEFPVYP